MSDDMLEIVSAEIHKCYCRMYEKRFGKPYWTNGDYSKLDEPTKNYDREMARWHIAQCEKLEKENAELKRMVFELQSVNDQLHLVCSKPEEEMARELLELRKRVEILELTLSGKLVSCPNCHKVETELSELRKENEKLKKVSGRCEYCEDCESLRELLREVTESMRSDFQSKCECEICKKQEELLTRIKEAVK